MPQLKTPKLQEIAAVARRYSICCRTAYRWLADGLAVNDPCAVALHLSTQKTPSPAAVSAVKKLLQKELETLSNS